ncbi:C40 family peptidase [Primorskyibacter sp. S187A]|uniref:C40 family peptidase n=1 Tax=Primorskyibacter sp. S187A TaxID=3415130 RepID=UPI003C7B08AD
MDRRRRPANDRVVEHQCAHLFPDLQPVALRAGRVMWPVVDLALDFGGARDRQLLFGQDFAVLEEREGLYFGISDQADYAGWVDKEAISLDMPVPRARCWVHVRQTHAYAAPDFKSPDLIALSLGSSFAPGAQKGSFVETPSGWVPAQHVGMEPESDPVAVAERLLGTPYLWGGNSAFGIDCSGLVQLAFQICGQPCPGDSDLQAEELGETLPPGSAFQRNDVLFWKGHVALVADAHTILHANAFHMAVAYERLEAAVERIQKQGDGPLLRHARLKRFEHI